ncbi:MAG: hypothetical protein J6B10_07060 [Lachnospiraceae bacterium]|nr:hypothetical protein [Lachnospiraceae bacterium]
MKLQHKIFCILLCTLAIGAGTVYCRVTHSPKYRIVSAVKRTFDNPSNGFTLSALSALSEQDSLYHTGSLTLSRVDISEELSASLPFEPYYLEGLGLRSSWETNHSAKTCALSSEISYLLKPYAHLECYAQDDTLSLRIPELFDTWLQIHPSSLADDFNASTLSSRSGIRLPDCCNHSLFPETDSATESVSSETGQLYAQFRKLLKTASVTKQPNSSARTNSSSLSYTLTFAKEPLDTLAALLFPSAHAASDDILFIPSDSMQITLSDGLVTAMNYTFILRYKKQSYPVVWELYPDGSKMEGSLLFSLADSEVRLSYEMELSSEDGTCKLNFNRLTLDASENTVTLHGNLTISKISSALESVSLPAEPTDSEAIFLFSMSWKDYMKMGREILSHLDFSSQSILYSILNSIYSTSE